MAQSRRSDSGNGLGLARDAGGASAGCVTAGLGDAAEATVVTGLGDEAAASAPFGR